MSVEEKQYLLIQYLCLCLCFRGGGETGDKGRECLRRGVGESEGSLFERDEGGDGDLYLEREEDGDMEAGDRRLRVLLGDPRFDRDGDDFRL